MREWAELGKESEVGSLKIESTLQDPNLSPIAINCLYNWLPHFDLLQQALIFSLMNTIAFMASLALIQDDLIPNFPSDKLWNYIP